MDLVNLGGEEVQLEEATPLACRIIQFPAYEGGRMFEYCWRTIMLH